MNEKLSSLVDGELPADEAAAAIKALANSDAARNDWRACHVIGEVMRGASPVRRTSTEAIFARLAAEPTILAPVSRRPAVAVGKSTRIVVAMAASVLTVSAISIIVIRQQTAEAPVALSAQAAPAATVQLASQAAAQSSATPAQVNDYLAIHRQYVQAGGLQEASFNRNASRRAAGQ